MRKITLSLTLSVGVALAGCATLMPLTPAPRTSPELVSPAYEPGDLVVNLQLRGSRSVQDADPNVTKFYSSEDIKTLEILPMLKVAEGDYRPLSMSGGTTTEGAPDQLKRVLDTSQGIPSVTLKNLAPNSTYRIRVRAFDAGKNQISKDAQSVSEDVVLTNLALLPQVNVPLYLVDKVFAATAKAYVSFDGELGGATQVRLTLWKKVGSDPEVRIGQPLVLDADRFPRAIDLEGLGPKATYTLLAEALDGAGEVLTDGRVEWGITNSPDLASKNLKLSFGARVTTYVSGSNPSDRDPNFLLVSQFTPFHMTRDTAGNLFVTDIFNDRIVKIAPGGAGPATTYVAGFGFGAVKGLAIDAGGNLFFSGQALENRIQRVASGSLAVSVYAGNDALIAPPGYEDKNGTAARFSSPQGMAIDDDGNIYVADYGNHRIRKIASNRDVTTVAGSMPGFADKNGPSAMFTAPYDVDVDAAGNLYVADSGNHRIRKIASNGDVTTVAGTGTAGNKDGDALMAMLNQPTSVHVGLDGTTLYVTDFHTVKEIKNGQVRTLAGSSDSGFAGGAASAARFNSPYYVMQISEKVLLVSEVGNASIRKIVLP